MLCLYNLFVTSVFGVFEFAEFPEPLVFKSIFFFVIYMSLFL